MWVNVLFVNMLMWGGCFSNIRNFEAHEKMLFFLSFLVNFVLQ